MRTARCSESGAFRQRQRDETGAGPGEGEGWGVGLRGSRSRSLTQPHAASRSVTQPRQGLGLMLLLCCLVHARYMRFCKYQTKQNLKSVFQKARNRTLQRARLQLSKVT